MGPSDSASLAYGSNRDLPVLPDLSQDHQGQSGEYRQTGYGGTQGKVLSTEHQRRHRRREERL